MAPRGLAGFIVGGVPRFLAQKTITVDATTDQASGMGVPRIVGVDDDPPQQRFRYVAAFAVTAAAAAQVFNPSPASAQRASVISAAWAPADPALQQPNKRIAAFTVAQVAAQADNPPAARHLEVILGAWAPADPAPQQANKRVAAFTVAPGVNPSPASAQRASVISAAWTPADLPPQTNRKLPQAGAEVAAQADNPPGAGVPKIVSLPDDPLPQVNRKLPQEQVVAAADYVPFTRHLEVLGAWEPIRFTVTSQIKIAALYPNQDAVPFTRHLEMLGAWTVTDPLPQTNRKLAQDQLIEGVPFTRHLEVLGTWAPVPYSVTLSVKIAPIVSVAVVVADIPPPVIRHPESIFAAWAAADPPITLPEKTAAVLAPALDVPPPLTRRLETVLGAWIAVPPQPILSGKLVQPQIAVAAADKVPFRRNLDWTPWDEVVPVKLVVSRAATDNAVAPAAQNDNPPFGYRRVSAWSWGPPVAYPGGGGEFVPQDVANDSAPATREWLDIVVRAWEPPPPLPTLPKKFTQAQAQVAPTSDNPPFTQRHVQNWAPFYPDPPLPTLPDKLVQAQVAATSDNPPFGRRLLRPDFLDALSYPNPTLGGPKLVQPGTAAQSDNPPFNQRRTQDWTHFYPAPPLPTLTIKQVQPGVVVQAQSDNPPFTSRRTQDWTHFYPPPPLPTLSAKLLQPGANNDPAPKGRPLWDWANFKPIDPNPTLGRGPLARENAAQTDNPPFNQRRVQDWTHFYPAPPLPTLTAKLVQPDVRDNPPFSQRRTQDYIHFKPIDPLPTLRAKLPQGQVPATSDNPPFTQRHTQFWTHWYPPNPQPDPLPTLGRKKQTPPSTNTPVPPVIVTQPPPDYGGDWWRTHHPDKSKSGKRCRFVTIDGVLTWICDNPSWERAAHAREQALDLVYDAEGDLDPLYEALRVEEATNSSEAKRNAATLLMHAIHEAILEEEDDDFMLMM